MKNDLSKHSQKNLAVIENFILFLTHCSDEKEPDFKVPQKYTPEELYRVAYDYIMEDHVDGEDSPEAQLTEEENAKAILEKSGYYCGNLWSLEDVKAKFKCTDDEAYKVLDGALQNDATMEQIWLAISIHGEDDGLVPVLQIDDDVEVPEPIEGDTHHYSFVGVIVNIRDEYATIEDQEGELFTIELSRLTKQ